MPGYYDKVTRAARVRVRALDANGTRLEIDADGLLDARNGFLLPKHLLEDAYRSDKATFLDLPYWTSGFIGAGPYRFVRNPIYTAMFGMLLATGLAISHWAALIGAGLVFAIGTRMRIRSEEKLLRESFGPEFEAYARSVPALVPRLSGFTTRSL